MFSAQLLRILQTIPSDVESETCADDSAEVDVTMEENQIETLHCSKSFGREVDPLTFERKEVYEINGLRRDTHPSPFELNSKDESWNPKFVDDLSTDSQKVTGDSAGEEFQNGLLYRFSSPEKDEYSLSSVPNDTDKAQSSPKHEHTVAGEEFVHHNEPESKDSRPPFISASNPFEIDSNLFSDKIVLECEHPELIVCYKEVNYHVVKDICIDDGMPVDRDLLTYSSKDDDQSDHSLSLNDDSHCKATEGVHKEFLISDELASTSPENTKDNIANEHGSEEECHGILLSQGKPESPDKDAAKDCDHKDSLQKGETVTHSSKESFVDNSLPIQEFGTPDKDAAKDCDHKDSLQKGETVTHSSKESFVDNSLPIQEFGTRSFLRSFLNSLDDGALPDQISSGKVVSEGCAPSSSETGPEEDIQATNLHYNSKVETGSITFNFNPAEIIKEQSVDSSDSLSDKDATSETAHDHQTLDSKDENPVLSSKGEVVSSHEHMDPDNNAVISFRRYDEGESSFSASGFINYSGPTTFSGNLSDGSAASGRSFAFPILPNEWNSSPARMKKGDRRHFRKHRGWRSGVLCCRF